MFTLILFDSLGAVASRSLRLPGKDLPAEEYLIGKVSKELYRDAMSKLGIRWDHTE